MLFRLTALALFFFLTFAARAQDVVVNRLTQAAQSAPSGDVASAWLDLRQTTAANTKTQVAPDWVEAVNLISTEATEGVPARTTFRIRLAHPNADFHVLMFRLFFDDMPGLGPSLVAWDESGTQVLRSGVLGLGVSLATSETVMVPMDGVSTIDIEVSGDGKTVRGAYLDWMISAEVLHPLGAVHRDLIPEPFAAAAPLHAPGQDMETFGTVTATLAEETIRIGPTVPQGAAFEFGLESQPLVALISFEVASPTVDSPPEIFVNGVNIGPASLTLPDLADPAYRGGMVSLARQMRFQYTGWLRAQKIVPANSLSVGTNDIVIISGGGAAASAIRATQIQLKYLWDKSDYQLQADR
jgi:hypothetical protein